MPEGQLAALIGGRPGLWVRAGMSAMVAGLDLKGADLLIPAGADRERVYALLGEWEIGMLQGAAKRHKADA